MKFKSGDFLSMLSEHEVKRLIDDIFEEEALIIGGMAAIKKIEDDNVNRIIRNFDLLRKKYFQRIEEKSQGHEETLLRDNRRLHPAIQEFIKKLKTSKT